ncbi:MAG: deoxyribose-phosphate aldolase, partial [Candidatus Eremiobacteraeota bacterium]|nr:deoxyribose-phosphate aldolase [Candidatus Eremiobacteraeota bacterium]
AVCSVIGFPLGATTTAQKAFETRTAIADGADEIDMVMNIGAFKDGDYDTVRSDIAAVVEAAGGHTVKVILENHYLQPQEIVEACHLAEQGGADFVKTSTGFAGSGAKVEDVALMRASVSPHIKVKAAGGVGSLEDARKMAEAGADRFGASRTEQILAGQTTASGY